MSTITKEWLQQKIAGIEATRDEIPFGLDEDDSNTLAALRIALASLEAEAVAYIIQDADARGRGEKGILRYFANISDEDINEYEITVTPLFTAPPAPVSVPDEVNVLLNHLEDVLPDEAFNLIDVKTWNNVSMLSRPDVYRAAMLQNGNSPAQSDCCPAQKCISPAQSDCCPAQKCISPAQDGNSPVIPDGWVACSERMPEEGDDMIVFTDEIVMSGVSYSKKKGFYLQALEYDDDEPVDNVTHWMPLPAAPQPPSQ